jgi:hypothetical protein
LPGTRQRIAAVNCGKSRSMRSLPSRLYDEIVDLRADDSWRKDL